MKTQNYCSLEQEVKIKTEALKYKSWRGDLSKSGLQNIQWNDLQYVQSEVKISNTAS